MAAVSSRQKTRQPSGPDRHSGRTARGGSKPDLRRSRARPDETAWAGFEWMTCVVRPMKPGDTYPTAVEDLFRKRARVWDALDGIEARLRADGLPDVLRFFGIKESPDEFTARRDKLRAELDAIQAERAADPADDALARREVVWFEAWYRRYRISGADVVAMHPERQAETAIRRQLAQTTLLRASGLDPLQTAALYQAWVEAGRERAAARDRMVPGMELGFDGPVTQEAALDADHLGMTWTEDDNGSAFVIRLGGALWQLPLVEPFVWPADRVLRGIRVRGPGRLERGHRVEFGFSPETPA